MTTSYYKPSQYPDKLAARWQKADIALRRRRLEGLQDGRIVRRWRYELPEVFVRSICGVGMTADRFMYRRDSQFDRWVSRHHAASGDVYWGFQGSCLESLRTARRSGRVAVAEFTTAHVTAATRILAREVERHPEWAATISNFHFPAWYRERLEQEPHEASFCVAASEFTRRSLTEVGIFEEQIKLLPLGADLSQFRPASRNVDDPFRILFVGGVGQRKGVKYLLEAYRRIKSTQTELRLVGPLPADLRPLTPYSGSATLTGRLNHKDVLRELYQAHVLVLPSVFEGFGLVIPEAMATGIPVIASTHTAAPEIIRDGRDGFVIEPDDVDGLAARLDFLAANRATTAEMGREASIRASEYSWDVHRERLALLLQELF